MNIYCDDFEEPLADEYPMKTIHLSKKNISALKSSILKNSIMELDDYIENYTCDGTYSSLIVYTNGGEHKTGGLNVDNKQFLAVDDFDGKCIWTVINYKEIFYKEEKIFRVKN